MEFQTANCNRGMVNLLFSAAVLELQYSRHELSLTLDEGQGPVAALGVRSQGPLARDAVLWLKGHSRAA
jgi:hypothetical protein